MSETIFFRLSGELILIFHIQNASRLHANYRRRVLALITKFGLAGGRIRRGREHNGRACLWQFRQYSVLSACRGDKQADACHPADRCYRDLLQNLHRKNYRLVSGTATAQAQDFVLPPTRCWALPLSRCFRSGCVELATT